MYPTFPQIMCSGFIATLLGGAVHTATMIIRTKTSREIKRFWYFLTCALLIWFLWGICFPLFDTTSSTIAWGLHLIIAQTVFVMGIVGSGSAYRYLHRHDLYVNIIFIMAVFCSLLAFFVIWPIFWLFGYVITTLVSCLVIFVFSYFG